MSKIPEWAVKEADLLIQLRAFHFNNAEEGRGGATRNVFASDLRKANALISEAATALSEAYTRGQMDMRERAAGISEMHSHQGVIAAAIRSLPLQDEEGK